MMFEDIMADARVRADEARILFPNDLDARKAWVSRGVMASASGSSASSSASASGSNSVLIGALVAIGGAGLLYMFWKGRRR